MLVLSENRHLKFNLPADVTVIKVSSRNIREFEGNEEVRVIVGSRVLAKICDEINFPAMKLFQLTSAGVDGVPLANYAEKKIAVANVGSVYSVPISETVVFGMLQMAKRLRNNPNNRRIKLLRRYNTISELYGKRALVLGVGSIGTMVAERLKPFQMEVDGYHPTAPQKEPYDAYIRNREELKKELHKYDYIISALPDNEQTRQFINQELLECMSRNAVIVNVGRSVVLDDDSLYMALKQNRIRGAVLDIFEPIPNPITNRYRRLNNVIVLPGVAAISQEVNERLEKHIVENIVAVSTGKEIKNVVNGVR